MDTIVPLVFRFVLYTFFGLALESIFAVTGIERALGHKLKKRTPHKYLEGFVSLYMIPLHGLGLLFGFEFLHEQIRDYHIIFRFIIWAISITGMEVLWGVICHKILGFYTWDYYKESKYKMFKEGYTLWTLVPLWGIAGIMLEFYSDLLIYISPAALEFIRSI